MQFRRSATFCLTAVAAMAVLAATVAGCGAAASQRAPGGTTNCGASRTAANVPVEIAVRHGQVSCAIALSIERRYARAIVAGKAPGNGGGGPVHVSGWTCSGFPTPELLKTGNASKCVKGGTEIIATLKAPA